MKKILYVLFILSMVGFILFNMVSAKDEFDLFKIASVLEHENVISMNGLYIQGKS